MPEFVGLWCGTLGIALADDDQSGSLDLFDVLNRRTLLIDGGIVVDRRTEEWNHPLVDQVLAIVTLPISDASTRYRAFEAVTLRHRPHRHVAAITPAGHPQSCRVDRVLGDGGIDSGENVAQIAASKVFYIRPSKLFSLTIASTGIWQQNVVTARRER